MFDESDGDEDDFGSDVEQDVRTLVQARKDAIQNPNALKRKQASPTDVVSAVVKRKREVVSLRPVDLLGQKGFSNLQTRLAGFNPTSARDSGGDELADLERMIRIYEAWAEGLQVREGADWPDFVEKLDRLKKIDIRKTIQLARQGDLKNPFSKVTEDAQLSVAASSAMHNSPQVTNLEEFPVHQSNPVPTATQETHHIQPQSAAVPQISEDMKAFIQRKREEAIRRRGERQKPVPVDNGRSATVSSVEMPFSSETQDVTQVVHESQVDNFQDKHEGGVLTAPTQLVSMGSEDLLVGFSQAATQVVETSGYPSQFPEHQADSQEAALAAVDVVDSSEHVMQRKADSDDVPLASDGNAQEVEL